MKSKMTSIIAVGLAMFAMFFGAGNLVFPLLLGKIVGVQHFYAVLGMLITAVAMPIIGLMSMVLYQGNYEEFFYRIGKIPGFFMIVLCLVLIGPFAGIPRTVTLTYALFDYTVCSMPLWLFSALACLVIFGFSIYKSKLIDVFAWVLTPLLLFLLAIILTKGLLTPGIPQVSSYMSGQAFFHGMKEGYNTLDLLAGLFFSTLIVLKIHAEAPDAYKKNPRYLILTTLKASLVGGGLLALIYLGMSYVTALHGSHPAIVAAEADQLIGAVSLAMLGEEAGLIAVLAMALACLTTAITLTIIFSEFIQKHIFINKLAYNWCVAITLGITFCVSLLGFSGIVKIVLPIILVLYPVFIVLSLLNIGHKLFGLKTVKLPLLITFVISLILYW